MDNEITPLYARITKADDATRIVEGLMSGPEQDLDQQVVDQTWLKEAIPAWMRYANIRQQHDPKMPIGKGISVDFTADGPVLRAKVVDDAAWHLVKEGVLSGFSIGVKNARVVRDGSAKNGRIVGGDLVETSLVDHPSYPKASVKIATKMAGNRWLDEQSGVSFEYKDASADMDHSEQTPGTQPSADGDNTAQKAASDPNGYTMAYQHYHGGVLHDHPHQGEDHTHCKKCGCDDRICGHRMKTVDADHSTETPVPDQKTTTPDAAKGGTSESISNDVKLTPDTTSATTMALGPSDVTTLLTDIKGMLESLKTTTPSFVEGKGEGAAAGFTELHTTDTGTFDESKTLYDAKHKSIIAEIVKESLSELLPSLVADALQKSFATDGDGALLTKGAAPDMVKQYVGDVAKSAVEAAVEPLDTRLKTVETMAAPVHGIANTRSVEKTFGPDGGDKPAPTLDSLARMIEHLPEADRMKAASIAIGEAQQQPMNLSGGFFR